MADRVVLHIGTMKSGTTYLQSVLGTGVLEPAGGWYVGGSFDAQKTAVSELLGPDPWPVRLWEGLVEEMRQRSGVAVLSHEFFSFMGDDRAQDVVRSLPAAEVTVVLTVRDQRRAIPAQWQSFARNRGLDDWATYQSRLSHPERRRGPRARRAVRSFRRAQNVPGMLRRWTKLEGVGEVVVVVVPPPTAGPTLLWSRFCDALGLNPGAPPEARLRSNESLGYASCEVLVTLNRMLKPWSREDFRRAQTAVVDALLPLRDHEGSPVLDRSGAALAAQLNATLVDALTTHGVRVVGDLRELSLDAGEDPPATTPPPDPGQLLRASTASWQALLPGVAPPDVASADEVLADLAVRLTGSVLPHEG